GRRSLIIKIVQGEGWLETEAVSSADSDEAGHAFQSEAGHPFRREAGRGSDLKPATLGVVSSGLDG
ncbi:MAG TPA: hypothetical protein VET85_00625, partial [Stellaceae bacterium]|nr:hypothetical protein [Stellaceae bacterium]